MSEPWQIALLVIFIIIGVYLLIVILDLGFVLSFHSLLRNHTTALNVLLHTKYDLLNQLLTSIEKYDSKIDKKYREVLNQININQLQNPETEIHRDIRLNLSYLRDELLYYVDKNNKINEIEEVIKAKQHILDLDQVYHVQISTYNADVIGYNYWIRFVPTRYIYNILHIKKKEII